MMRSIWWELDLRIMKRMLTGMRRQSFSFVPPQPDPSTFVAIIEFKPVKFHPDHGSSVDGAMKNLRRFDERMLSHITLSLMPNETASDESVKLSVVEP